MTALACVLRTVLVLPLLGGTAAIGAPVDAAPARVPDIDKTVSDAMTAFSVPGMAVGIIKDGQLIFAKGYGVRETGKAAKVDADTLFAIGSNTKAFTTAALAILVDEGKLGWDDKVIDHLPDFRMYDPYVTREFTIRDLLTHRSGLGANAGDLMFYPVTDFTREDIIHALRYLKPVSSFRSEFAYDNLLYLVAGQLIPAVTGMSWEDFVATHILRRLAMAPCAVGMKFMKDRSNVATPHAMIDGKMTVVPPTDFQVVGAAGAIQCNISGMTKWVQTQLAGGRSPTGEQLFTEARSQEMWSPQTLLPGSSELDKLTRTHFKAYALGWGLEDFNGYEQVMHSGGVPGMVTQVSLIPELHLGVLVFSNQQEMGALSAVSLHVLDAYVGAPQRDWVGVLKSMDERAQKEAVTATAEATSVANEPGKKPVLPLTAYTGLYHDAWRGDASVRLQEGQLILKFSHTEGLEGVLKPFSGNIFIVHWNDRSLDADTYVRFSQGFEGAIEGMTMRAVAPGGSSFDANDLDFKKMHESAPTKSQKGNR